MINHVHEEHKKLGGEGNRRYSHVGLRLNWQTSEVRTPSVAQFLQQNQQSQSRILQESQILKIPARTYYD